MMRPNLEQTRGRDPSYLAQLYWTQRKAIRKFRAPKGKFGPKSCFRPSRIAKRFTRRGPSRGDTPARGFFVGEYFVSLDHIPEEVLQAFFQGKSTKANGKHGKDQRCFNCGKHGHFAADCSEPQKCFNCGRTGHVKAQCTAPAKAQRSIMWANEVQGSRSQGGTGFWGVTFEGEVTDQEETSQPARGAAPVETLLLLLPNLLIPIMRCPMPDNPPDLPGAIRSTDVPLLGHLKIFPKTCIPRPDLPIPRKGLALHSPLPGTQLPHWGSPAILGGLAHGCNAKGNG